MFIKRTALALSLALAISAIGVATASPDTPEQRLAELATQGNAQAQFELGHALLLRGGDAGPALEWLRKAAQAHLPEANRELARYYLSLPDSLEHWLQAAEQLRAAAAAGDAQATRVLALATARRSLSTSLSTTERAALALQATTELQAPRYRDDADALFHLGCLTLQGLGVSPDPQRAFVLIQSAAQRKHAVAAFWVARQYLSATATAAEQDAGLRYLEMAARAGHVQAMRELAQRLGPQDTQSADYWAEQARTHSGSLSPIATASAVPLSLADVGGGGLGVVVAPAAPAAEPVNTPITDSLRAENTQLRQALAKANAKIRELVAELTSAKTTIAQLTSDLRASRAELAAQQQRAAAPPAVVADNRSPAEHNRAGLAAVAARDYAAAAAEFRQAADDGHAVAEGNLGLLQVQGLGVPKDVRQGIARLEHSAGQGNAAAAQAIGDLFRYGVEIQVDPNQALAWYQRAADLGSESAQQLVVAMRR